MKISEFIKELEKIKKEHGDLPVKAWEYDEYDGYYYSGDVDLPEYHKPAEDEECVIIGNVL